MAASGKRAGHVTARSMRNMSSAIPSRRTGGSGRRYYAAHNLARDVPGLIDVNRIAFDGSVVRDRASDRQAQRDQSRSRLRVSMEPRWGLRRERVGAARACDRRRIQAFRRRGAGPGQALLGASMRSGPRNGPRIQASAADGCRRPPFCSQRRSRISCRRSFLSAREARYLGEFQHDFPDATRSATRSMWGRRCCGRSPIRSHSTRRSSRRSPAARPPIQDFGSISTISRRAQFRAKLSGRLPMKKARPRGRAF